MSRQLPVPARNEGNERALTVQRQQGIASSPLARLAISMAPDLLRAAEQIIVKRAERPSQQHPAHGMQGQSVQLSEVEIDTSIPFVRRVTLRSATSWTTFPAIEPEPAPTGRLRKGSLIGVSGAAAFVAAVMVRRLMPAGRIIDVTGRQRE